MDEHYLKTIEDSYKDSLKEYRLVPAKAFSNLLRGVIAPLGCQKLLVVGDILRFWHMTGLDRATQIP